jgi:hypothetical protein
MTRVTGPMIPCQSPSRNWDSIPPDAACADSPDAATQALRESATTRIAAAFKMRFRPALSATPASRLFCLARIADRLLSRHLAALSRLQVPIPVSL